MSRVAGRPGSVWAVALASALVLPGVLVLGAGPVTGAASALGPHQRSLVSNNFTVSTINYTSSVDGLALSYSEILPLNYSPSQTYPLAIELHGISTSDSTPMPGGYPTPVVNTTAQAAVDAGFIEIVINTRTGDGFYVDSTFDGPQAQDVLDAIHHEQALRHIGALYIFGFSMGSMGALSIGLNHPGMFAGIGAIAAFSDDYELEDRTLTEGNGALWSAGLLPTGGQWPNTSAYARGIFSELSALRFHPQNASGTKLYLAGGGLDVWATNNPLWWPYEQGNDSVLDSSCDTVPALGEVANCTTPLAALMAEDPTDYSFRYLFEPNGIHDYELLNATDMFGYFTGERSPGTYWGIFPEPTAFDPPQPLVTVVTEPSGCGAIALNGTPEAPLQTVPQARGWVPVTFLPCAGEELASVTVAGSVSYDLANSTLHVTGSGSVVAVFQSPGATVQFAADSVCQEVLFDGADQSANTSLDVANGAYPVAAATCAGYHFLRWSTAGGVSVANATAPTTTASVAGSGTLSFAYGQDPTPPPLVSLTVVASPAACGPVVVNGSLVSSPSTFLLRAGAYNASAAACAGHTFASWSISGGVTEPIAASGSFELSSAGTLTAVYSPAGAAPYTVTIRILPTNCTAAVDILGAWYENGSSVSLAGGTYPITARGCPYGNLSSWSTTGSVYEGTGTLTVAGNGSLTAVFVVDGPGIGSLPPPNSTAPTPSYLLAGLALAGGVAIGAVVGIVVRRRPPAAPPT